MLDVLYVAYNRLEMTRESFTALVLNTEWGDDATALYVRDDGSDDGTAEWLQAAVDGFRREHPGFPVVFNGERLVGPVASMNWYLDQRTDADRFAKIDSDFVVPPLWLRQMCLLMTDHPEIDILGIEPWNPEPPVHGVMPGRDIVPTEHIGGKGIIRKRAFERCRPNPSGFNGYGGFTEWQIEHQHVTKAWVKPDLCAFGLDQLPFDPWLGLTAKYVAKGWQRPWPWPPYTGDGTMDEYWDWWVRLDRTRRETA